MNADDLLAEYREWPGVPADARGDWMAVWSFLLDAGNDLDLRAEVRGRLLGPLGERVTPLRIAEAADAASGARVRQAARRADAGGAA